MFEAFCGTLLAFFAIGIVAKLAFRRKNGRGACCMAKRQTEGGAS